MKCCDAQFGACEVSRMMTGISSYRVGEGDSCRVNEYAYLRLKSTNESIALRHLRTAASILIGFLGFMCSL
jgi:hypothetical protein